jgi:peptidyl-prolyl cis-trans isomerase-like 2
MPFTTPVCTRHNGIVFDKKSIETFLEENRNTDPVTGNPLLPSDLVQLQMDQDEEGRWQCPILTKPFANHTKIVAIVQPPNNNNNTVVANVYSYEAYQELNIKPNNYHDLISGAKFHKRNDVLILNNPEDAQLQQRRDINTFYHIQNQRQLLEQAEKTSGNNTNIRHSVTATRILDKYNKQQKDPSATDKKRSSASQDSDLLKDLKEGKRLKVFSDDVTGVKFTAGKASGSLTSTAVEVTHNNDAREATQEEILKALCVTLRRLSKKAYVRLETNKGRMLLEIHCDMVPQTAINFIKLCEAKKYNGSKFHRLIPNFMIQGGKPSKDNGDDDDDESFWGGSFKDEFHDKLKHDAPGILSMANAGAHTNKRQFFLTFQPCEHLNKKHSVFGVVIEGLEVLKEMAKIPTDKKHRPTENVIIQDTVIVDNPVEEAEALERKRIEARAKARSDVAVNNTDKAKLTTRAQQLPTQAKSHIGRYLPKTAAAGPVATPTSDGADTELLQAKPAAKPKVGQTKPKMKFGNFSGW